MWTELDDAAEAQTSLVLRTCNADMTSHGGFVWPTEGPVQCDDWSDEPVCGGGLFGLLWGEGNGRRLSWDADAKWLAVRVLLDDVVWVGGEKVKYPLGIVEHCGNQETATRYIAEHGGSGRAIVGLSLVSGNSGQSVSGDSGQSVSGNSGKSVSGDGGKSVSGDGGQSVSGDTGQSVSGDGGKSLSGNSGKSVSGDSGQSVSGNSGQSVSGNSGQSVSGYSGQSVSGDSGQSVSGYSGQSESGNSGILCISYWDTQDQRERLAIAYVGENGIEANTPYKLNDAHDFEEFVALGVSEQGKEV